MWVVLNFNSWKLGEKREEGLTIVSGVHNGSHYGTWLNLIDVDAVILGIGTELGEDSGRIRFDRR